jgi:ketosteroid isomerase-like protein
MDVIAEGDRAAIQFVVREYAPHLGRELVSEQIVIVRASEGKLVSVVGYYDSAEFHRLFWDDGMP